LSYKNEQNYDKSSDDIMTMPSFIFEKVINDKRVLSSCESCGHQLWSPVCSRVHFRA